MNPFIIQIIGFIGLMFVALSFQKNKRSFILLFQLFAALTFAVHFSLLFAWTGAVMTGLSAIRAFTFSFKESKRWINRKITLYSFIALFWIAGLLTWGGYTSLFLIISMTLECFSLWNNNPKYIRILFLSARPFWIIYDFVVGSYAGLVTEAFIVTSLAVAIIRFDILKKKEPGVIK